jgi:hypothetical protein
MDIVQIGYLFIVNNVRECFWPFSLESYVFQSAVYNYYSLILPVVLHEYEAWFLTLREKFRLRIFGRVLTNITGLAREKITEGCHKKLQNDTEG